MAAFDYRQTEEIRDAFASRGERYLFLGKSGAVLLGLPDTTQDADLFPEKSVENGRAIVAALTDLGIALSAQRDDIIASQEESGRMKDYESLPRLKLFRDYWIKTLGDT